MAAPGERPASDPAATYPYALAVSGDTACDPPSNAVYVGGSGTLDLTMADGAVVTFTAVAGTVLPIRTTLIEPGTATAIVALW